MQIPELKRKRFKINSGDILPISVAGLSIGVIVLSGATLWFALSFSRLAHQKPPTLVQQIDGKAFTARPAVEFYREPEVIRRTVADWAVLTFTWGKPPGTEKGQIDQGKLLGEKRIPTNAWEASFLITPEFRESFLKQLAAEIIPQDTFRGQSAAILVPQHFSVPEVAGQGRWRINMVATRIVFDANNPTGQTISFNRVFYVRAISPPQNPLAQPINDYQRLVYSLLERGIQIEEIRPMEQQKS